MQLQTDLEIAKLRAESRDNLRKSMESLVKTVNINKE
jgi:hypothetical protein